MGEDRANAMPAAELAQAKGDIIEDVAVFVAEVGQPPTARRYGMTYALALAGP